MDHSKIKMLISSFLDGEVDKRQTREIERHLAECAECQKEYETMKKMEEVMGKMKLKSPPEDVWRLYWAAVYNRLERRIGWIFLSLGAIIILFYGGYKMAEGIIQDASTPLLLKIGILAVLAGMAVLLVSFLRERLFIRKRERYKEVER